MQYQQFLNQSLEKSFVGFSSRECFKIVFNNEDTDIVTTISKYWLTMEELKNEKKFNEGYKTIIDHLKKQFAGWRRVRGDGNCYYRSVIASFMLKIFHYNENELRLYTFIINLQKIDIPVSNEYNISLNYMIDYLGKEYYARSENRKNKIESFIRINHMLQNKSFDEHLIRVARLISLKKFVMCIGDPDEKEISPYVIEDEAEMYKQQIVEYGREAEGIELKLLPYGLGISVHQINILENLLVSKYPDEIIPDDNLIINIISKSRGHYDMLYTIKDMEEQEYCLSEKSNYYDPRV